ncbi:MAG TPA: hypothetical protein VG898_06365 [Solirubrobacterales bacterium]|nr:hypothetical protein [Solirubrobacterales bacterium]
MIERAMRAAGLLGIAGALALAAGGTAQARHGADDPPGQHHEHTGKKHHKHRGEHHHHHGHGSDDGPNHS